MNGGSVSTTVGAGVGVRRGPGVAVSPGAADGEPTAKLAAAPGDGEANATGPGTARMLATIHAVSRPLAAARITTTTAASNHVARLLDDFLRRGAADGPEERSDASDGMGVGAAGAG